MSTFRERLDARFGPDIVALHDSVVAMHNRADDFDKRIARLQEQVTRLQLKAADIATGQELADEFTGAGSALRSSMEGGA